MNFGELLLYGFLAAGVICALGLAGMVLRWFVRGWKAEQTKGVQVIISIGQG